jgi:nucleotide-binding universal stress UspA family protein
MKKIVYPTDGSETANRALKTAAELAEALKADCLVLTVAQLDHGWIPSGMESQMERELEKEAKRIAVEAVQKLEQAGVSAAIEITAGNPSEQIVNVAEREKADFIVMGTHGHAGLARVLIGSVADRVMRKAGCPVVLVP